MRQTLKREMSFLEHLEELRRRILISLIVLVVFSVISYTIAPIIVSFISKPVGELYFFAPHEGFLVRLKTSFFTGFLFSLPVILYEIWAFIAPALNQNEKKKILPVFLVSPLLFYTGVAFSIFIVVPLGVQVLLKLGGEDLVALINASKYVNFVFLSSILLAFIFETPLITVALTNVGVLNPELLKRRRREVIVAIFVITAILTPSVDFITLLLVALPLVFLFELSLFLSRRVKH